MPTPILLWAAHTPRRRWEHPRLQTRPLPPLLLPHPLILPFGPQLMLCLLPLPPMLPLLPLMPTLTPRRLSRTLLLVPPLPRRQPLPARVRIQCPLAHNLRPLGVPLAPTLPSRNNLSSRSKLSFPRRPVYKLRSFLLPLRRQPPRARFRKRRAQLNTSPVRLALRPCPPVVSNFPAHHPPPPASISSLAHHPPGANNSRERRPAAASSNSQARPQVASNFQARHLVV